MRSKFFSLFALLVIASMMLAACAPSATPTPQTITVVVEKEGTPVVQVVTATPGPVVEPTGPKVLRLNTGGSGDVPTLDPAVSEDTTSIQVIEETFVGLTHLNEVTAATEPGMATAWDISRRRPRPSPSTCAPTFRGCAGTAARSRQVKTCDGSADRMVTANDFAYGILRNLAPATASPYAYVLAACSRAA